MTPVAITGIKDPLRVGVCEAVATCHRQDAYRGQRPAARSIATRCGIYTTGGIIMEGTVFRALDPQDHLEAVPRLQVSARSSPEDKKETLRSLWVLPKRPPASSLWTTTSLRSLRLSRGVVIVSTTPFASSSSSESRQTSLRCCVRTNQWTTVPTLRQEESQKSTWLTRLLHQRSR